MKPMNAISPRTARPWHRGALVFSGPLVGLLGLVAGVVQAQTASPPVLASTWKAAAAASAALATPPAVGASTSSGAQPATGLKRRPVVMPSTTESEDLRIIEDDNVRIEETRSNGQLRRVSVAPKGRHTPRYAIVVPVEGGNDMAKVRAFTGQRVWHLFDF